MPPVTGPFGAKDKTQALMVVVRGMASCVSMSSADPRIQNKVARLLKQAENIHQAKNNKEFIMATAGLE